MMFCEKCSGLLIPKDGKMVCPKCGFKSKDTEKTELKETVKNDKPSVEVIEQEAEAYPLVDQECPKCGHKELHMRGVPCTELKCPKCGTSMKGVFCS